MFAARLPSNPSMFDTPLPRRTGPRKAWLESRTYPGFEDRPSWTDCGRSRGSGRASSVSPVVGLDGSTPAPCCMHVHALRFFEMRTTIELTDEQRSRLLELGAKRGLKGFSLLVQEAVDRFLQQEARREDLKAAALAALGSLDEESARGLEASVRAARSQWR